VKLEFTPLLQVQRDFGDVAAASISYTPLGLSERAGFALALRDARIKM